MIPARHPIFGELVLAELIAIELNPRRNQQEGVLFLTGRLCRSSIAFPVSVLSSPQVDPIEQRQVKSCHQQIAS